MRSHHGVRRPHLSIAIAACVGLLAASDARSEETIEYVSGEVQVKLGPGAAIADIHRDYGTTCIDSLPPSYLLRIPADEDEQAFVGALLADPCVQDAECSWRDETPEGVRQMIVIAVGGTLEDYLDQNLVERIHLADIHARLTGRGVTVAVLDTGVLSAHEALAGCLAPGGYDFVDGDADPEDTADGLDGDGDGEIDEGAGHGTMVAGLVHLVAPDARILPIRVLDDEGTGRTFALARGIRHALEQGADVINLSLGLTQHTYLIQDEVLLAADQDVPIVAAAGNLAAEAPPYYPAMDPQALSIAALDSSDVKAPFSNWHRSVDLSAPGVGILAPYHDGGYAIGEGTSFATPFVSGQVALILEAMPGLRLHRLQDLAMEGTIDIYDIPENLEYLNELGEGRVDGVATIEAVDRLTLVASVADVPGNLRIDPNPSRRTAGVLLTLPERAAPSRLEILDVAGRVIRRHDVEMAERELSWDGLDDRGRAVVPGIYFVRICGPSGSSIAPGRLLRIE